MTAGVTKNPYLRSLYTVLLKIKRATATKRNVLPHVNNNQPRAIIKVGSRKLTMMINRKPAVAELKTFEYSRVPPSKIPLMYKTLISKIKSQRKGNLKCRR